MNQSELQLVPRLERLFDSMATRGKIKHALVVVERGDGSFRWVGARGEAQADGSPMGEQTPYMIASIDKLYVAALIMKCEEMGRLSIDDRLIDRLPAADGLHRLDGVDHTHEVTLRHLLSHTSGIPDALEDRPREGKALIDTIIEEGDRTITLEEAVAHARTIKPHFAPQPLDAPKPKIRYSSTNFELLMLVVEAVTGSPIHTVLSEWIFEPLRLDHTFVMGMTEPRAEVQPPATLWVGDHPVDRPLFLGSYPSVFSTAVDTIGFMKAVVDGRLFDRPTTFERMQERMVRFGFPKDRSSLRAPSWPIEYGLGIKRFQIPSYLPPFQRVPAVVGHTGSTGTWLFYCPQLDLYTAGTVDQVTAAPLPYRFVPRVLRTF